MTNTGRQTRQKLREPLQRAQWLYLLFFFSPLPSVKAHSFQLGALSYSKRFCCTWWEGTWLCNCAMYCLLLIAYVANICSDNCVSLVFGKLTYFCRSWQYPFSWRFKKSYGGSMLKRELCCPRRNKKNGEGKQKPEKAYATLQEPEFRCFTLNS